ncbi:hypothetical protein KEK_09327 [Mycolicibacterium thermoresistibile ATCC 19527]|uniref:Uncharacterized protein n=1 Tax=Mycolicibacterium thermoresistibile (strain ATCC 19527 / DSM 44167 / CIP 105390 / JCM 6362 / NCTC 10409 / 316) TaxID=1078020 RepID=G7CFU4_MYCT3|nr:hypothetical protein KEK_09327 [Mycolicibacterium thermoresistibile ATCC 19527]
MGRTGGRLDHDDVGAQLGQRSAADRRELVGYLDDPQVV